MFALGFLSGMGTQMAYRGSSTELKATSVRTETAATNAIDIAALNLLSLPPTSTPSPVASPPPAQSPKPSQPLPVPAYTIVTVTTPGTSFWSKAHHELKTGGHKPTNAEIVKYLNTQFLPLNGRKTLAECTMAAYPPSKKDPANPNRLLLGETIKVPNIPVLPNPTLRSSPASAAPSIASPSSIAPQNQVKTSSLATSTSSTLERLAQDAATPSAAYAAAPAKISPAKYVASASQFRATAPPVKRYADSPLLRERLATMVEDYQQFLCATYDAKDITNRHVTKADEQMLRKYSHLGTVAQLHNAIKRAVHDFSFKLGQESLHLIDEEKLYQVQEMDAKFKSDFRLDELLDGAQRILGVRIDAGTYSRLVFRDVNKPVAKPEAVQSIPAYQTELRKAA